MVFFMQNVFERRLQQNFQRHALDARIAPARPPPSSRPPTYQPVDTTHKTAIIETLKHQHENPAMLTNQHPYQHVEQTHRQQTPDNNTVLEPLFTTAIYDELVAVKQDKLAQNEADRTPVDKLPFIGLPPPPMHRSGSVESTIYTDSETSSVISA